MGQETKLNIGAGGAVLDGYTPLDADLGHDAKDLSDYADGSVSEIRASHILEHLSYHDACEALREWFRVLKPGGSVEISVPDFAKIAEQPDEDTWRFHLMGGQTDEHDFHRSAWTEKLLSQHLNAAGYVDVVGWDGDKRDTSSHPVSLNLKASKPGNHTGFADIKIAAIVPQPRWVQAVARDAIERALRPFNIPMSPVYGVFWGQVMQRTYEWAVEQGVDWILSIDGDSMFTAQHLDTLIGTFGQRPDIDALAALQMRRGQEFPLFTHGHDTEIDVLDEPVKVTTAHFGLTLIRTECLAKVAKPWFKDEPDQDGRWEDGRMDADIWFWHQWRQAGLNIYIDPKVSIGHLEEVVSVYDSAFKPHHMYVKDWQKQFANGGK